MCATTTYVKYDSLFLVKSVNAKQIKCFQSFDYSIVFSVYSFILVWL